VVLGNEEIRGLRSGRSRWVFKYSEYIGRHSFYHCTDYRQRKDGAKRVKG